MQILYSRSKTRIRSEYNCQAEVKYLLRVMDEHLSR